MTETPSSALAQQLLNDMKTIDETLPASFWGGTMGRLVKDVERETAKSRVLATYVAHLLDRVEQLESRLDGK